MQIVDKLLHGSSESIRKKREQRTNTLQCPINRDQLDFLMRYYHTKSYVEAFRVAYNAWNNETLIEYSELKDGVNIVVSKEFNHLGLSQEGIREMIEAHVLKIKGNK